MRVVVAHRRRPGGPSRSWSCRCRPTGDTPTTPACTASACTGRRCEVPSCAPANQTHDVHGSVTDCNSGPLTRLEPMHLLKHFSVMRSGCRSEMFCFCLGDSKCKLQDGRLKRCHCKYLYILSWKRRFQKRLTTTVSELKTESLYFTGIILKMYSLS